MLAAIQLNHQPVFQAHEIDNEGANGLLPLELRANESVTAQVIPKPLLGIGHFLT